jgi:tRNA(Ile2) C34 agmatinyltransferase TiaS
MAVAYETAELQAAARRAASDVAQVFRARTPVRCSRCGEVRPAGSAVGEGRAIRYRCRACGPERSTPVVRRGSVLEAVQRRAALEAKAARFAREDRR